MLALIEDRAARNELRDEALANGWNTREIREAVEVSKGHKLPVRLEGTVSLNEEENIEITPAPGTDRTGLVNGYAKIIVDYLQ
jgi:hypothetical protein